jgi:hypothetical protein
MGECNFILSDGEPCGLPIHKAIGALVESDKCELHSVNELTFNNHPAYYAVIKKHIE